MIERCERRNKNNNKQMWYNVPYRAKLITVFSVSNAKYLAVDIPDDSALMIDIKNYK